MIRALVMAAVLGLTVNAFAQGGSPATAPAETAPAATTMDAGHDSKMAADPAAKADDKAMKKGKKGKKHTK